MTSRNTRDQVVALAGLFQAAQLVRQLAWEGSADADATRHSLMSIFATEADSILDVYGGYTGVGYGLSVLRGQLGGDPQSRDNEVTRYSATLLHLERKLARDPAMLTAIGEGIAAARVLLEQYGIAHSAVSTRLAGVYQETLSTLAPRVMVNGEDIHLRNEETASRIRALLLGGIRAAVLWRQCRGSRWRLLIGRGALLHAAEKIIHSNIQ